MVEINYESRGTYNVSNQITFKTSMIRSNFYDYSGEYILVSETITITEEGADDAAKRTDKKK